MPNESIFVFLFVVHLSTGCATPCRSCEAPKPDSLKRKHVGKPSRVLFADGWNEVTAFKTERHVFALSTVRDVMFGFRDPNPRQILHQ